MTTMRVSNIRKAPLAKQPTARTAAVQQWIDKCVELCQPQNIHVCDGSLRERRELIEEGVRKGVFIAAQPKQASKLLLASQQPK